MKNVLIRSSRSLTATLVLTAAFTVFASAQVPAPEAFFGFRMGADGQLAAWPDIVL